MQPILVVDFEASCIGDHSYPIEAGIARWDGPGGDILTWSSLIAPDPDWVRYDDWTIEAQRVHGISPLDLEQGRCAGDVAAGLLTMSAGIDHVLCDGGRHDAHWLRKLVAAARWSTAPFALADFDETTAKLPGPAYMGMLEVLEHTPIPHRAGPDAVRMVQACVVGLTGSWAKVRVLTDRDVLPDG